MATNGPLNTPFGDPLVGTPSPSEATRQGGGVSLNEGGAAGLQGTPFERPIARNPGTAATANSSEIPNDWLTDGGIPNAPAPGSTAAVAGGVATPNTPAGNMAGGKN